MTRQGGQSSGRPAERELPAKPRRVRGGRKLTMSVEDLSRSWAANRWLRLVESAASGDAMVEGLEYAQLGQTRQMDVVAGAIEASVQGRRPRAYTTRISLRPLAEEDWQRVAQAMAEQAVYVAKLLAGELPSNIEDVFAPLGLRLFPADASEVATECTCPGVQPWCKHAVAAAHLFAQQLAEDPFVVFALRGSPAEELGERLHAQRAAAGASGAVPVYVPHLARLTEAQPPALEESLERFWEAGAQLDEVHAPLEPPQVSHPLLRRLGPSPFASSTFPLVGLLATCYDVMSDDVLRESEHPLTPGEAPPAGEAGTRQAPRTPAAEQPGARAAQKPPALPKARAIGRARRKGA